MRRDSASSRAPALPQWFARRDREGFPRLRNLDEQWNRHRHGIPRSDRVGERPHRLALRHVPDGDLLAPRFVGLQRGLCRHPHLDRYRGRQHRIPRHRLCADSRAIDARALPRQPRLPRGSAAAEVSRTPLRGFTACPSRGASLSGQRCCSTRRAPTGRWGRRGSRRTSSRCDRCHRVPSSHARRARRRGPRPC